MRKLIVQEFVTIDLYAATTNGKLDFMPSPSDQQHVDDSIEEYQFEFIDSLDTCLLGRNTYQMFARFWPDATTKTEIIADKLNAMPKIVFSHTLEKAPWGKWEPARIEKGSAAETIKRLKQQQGKNMIIWGSLILAQSLMKTGLIDEYSLMICPSVIGNGRKLFPDDFSSSNYKLLETKTFYSGTVMLRYEPAK